MSKRILAVIVAALVVLTATQAFAAGFEVARFVMASSIQDREPVGELTTCSSTMEKAYAFLEARNIAADETVTFVWLMNGTEVSRVETTIKAGWRWRTYSSKGIAGAVGDWEVKLLDSTGAEVKSITFKVE